MFKAIIGGNQCGVVERFGVIELNSNSVPNCINNFISILFQ